MDKEKIYFDASFIISLLTKEHVFNGAARNKLNVIQNQSIYISALTLDECVFNLNYYSKDKDITAGLINNLISDLDGLKELDQNVNFNSFKTYLSFWKQSRLKPRDAMHIFLMKQNKIKTIATFDKDFIKYQKELKIKVI